MLLFQFNATTRKSEKNEYPARKNSSLQSQKLVPAKYKKPSVHKNNSRKNQWYTVGVTISTETDSGFYLFNADTILFL